MWRIVCECDESGEIVLGILTVHFVYWNGKEREWIVVYSRKEWKNSSLQFFQSFQIGKYGRRDMNGMEVFWFYLIWILFFYLLPTFKQLEWWIVSIPQPFHFLLYALYHPYIPSSWMASVNMVMQGHNLTVLFFCYVANERSSITFGCSC